MAKLVADKARVNQGVAAFLDALTTEANKRGERVEVAADATGRKTISDTIASVIEARFKTQAEALAFTTKEERLQSKRKGLWQCVVRALHRRLCGNPEASKKVEDAIKKAKLTEPTATGLSVGAATIVALAIGGLFSGPIAVAAAPVLGGLAFLLMMVGVDGFCEWGADASAASEQPKEAKGKDKSKRRK